MLSLSDRRKRLTAALASQREDRVAWPPASRTEVGAPLAWGIALAAVATVFAIIAIIANYGPLNSTDRAQLVERELPISRYQAIGALITASGETCLKVCSIKPKPNLSGLTELDVACAKDARSNACVGAAHYAIAVAKQD
jgi:hypothetical protein